MPLGAKLLSVTIHGVYRPGWALCGGETDGTRNYGDMLGACVKGAVDRLPLSDAASWCLSGWRWWIRDRWRHDQIIGGRQMTQDQRNSQELSENIHRPGATAAASTTTRVATGASGEIPSDALVTVIVPAYNVQVSIGETLSSLLRQTWSNLEIIVVDDGSSDKSVEIARMYASLEVPGRTLAVMTKSNGGVGSARNLGLTRARGEWIIFLDSDDAFVPGAVAHMVAARNKLGDGKWLVEPNAVEVTRGGLNTRRTLAREPMPSPRDQREVILQYNFGAFTSLFPREFFDEVGVFDETMAFVEDWEFWIRAVYSGWRFHRTEEVLCKVWATAGSMMSNRAAMDAGEDQALRRNLARFRDEMTPAEVAFVERRLDVGSPQGLLKAMAANLRDGNLEEAKAQLNAAASVMPAQKRVVMKQRISRLPGGMKWLQKRQATIDGYVDYDPSTGR